MIITKEAFNIFLLKIDEYINNLQAKFIEYSYKIKDNDIKYNAIKSYIEGLSLNTIYNIEKDLTLLIKRYSFPFSIKYNFEEYRDVFNNGFYYDKQNYTFFLYLGDLNYMRLFNVIPFEIKKDSNKKDLEVKVLLKGEDLEILRKKIKELNIN